jgi:hypothetical protein
LLDGVQLDAETHAPKQLNRTIHGSAQQQP